MKSLFTWFFLLVVAMANAQDEAELIATSIGKGDAAVIGKFLVTSVDLTILDDEDIYPKDVVVKKLNAFFAKHAPVSFEVKHKGKSKLDDHYRIGDLVTKNGKFRVTFFLKKGTAGMEIKQLRIEPYE